MVQLNAAIAPPQNFVALGDSIVESVYLSDVCGTSFNAGIGGGKIGDVQFLAESILKRLRPHMILVAVGTNDVWAGAGIAEFRQKYSELLNHLPVAKTMLMGVPNSAAASATIRDLAVAHSFTYVAPVTGPGLTVDDGAHLKSLGAIVFRNRIERACNQLSQPASP
ncbi:SGNH/GDSL hydrolase family protein [Flavisphingomonas formosensis]|uniref:SGNH/GDSL hydrolase family protein n=1 Tax=Flavisphingomonas formosensis TaxID=861534 RepID=UPI0012F85BE1|nr:SGNH/GDSL hydrolase family protein [Sphingomonas formosensis]